MTHPLIKFNIIFFLIQAIAIILVSLSIISVPINHYALKVGIWTGVIEDGTWKEGVYAVREGG